MKTLCAAMDNRYSDYYGLEEGLVRSCNLGNFRSEFRSVMAYLDQIGETELIREWKETLAQLGVEVPMPKKRNSGKPVFPGTKIIETGFTSEKYVFPFETLRVIFHEESPVFSQPLNVPVT